MNSYILMYEFISGGVTLVALHTWLGGPVDEFPANFLDFFWAGETTRKNPSASTQKKQAESGLTCFGDVFSHNMAETWQKDNSLDQHKITKLWWITYGTVWTDH